MVALGLLTGLAGPTTGLAQPGSRGLPAVEAALANARMEITRLRGLSSVPRSSVVTVDVATVAGDADRARVAALIEERRSEIELVRQAVDLGDRRVVAGSDPDSAVRLERALAERDVAVDEILALAVEGDRIVVYHVDPRVLAELLEP